MTTVAERPAAAPRVEELPTRVQTVFTARIVEVEGLLARVAVQLNPYDVRELQICLDSGTLRAVVEGDGFDAGRVAARLGKIIGVLSVSHC